MTATFDAFRAAVDTAPGGAYATESREDWGTLRGQGRRRGGTVLGGLRDASLQGVRTYTHPAGALPARERADLATFGPHNLLGYCKARATGLGHGVAFLAGLGYPDLADAYELLSRGG